MFVTRDTKEDGKMGRWVRILDWRWTIWMKYGLMILADTGEFDSPVVDVVSCGLGSADPKFRI